MGSLTTLLQREKKEGRVEGNGLQRCFRPMATGLPILLNVGKEAGVSVFS